MNPQHATPPAAPPPLAAAAGPLTTQHLQLVSAANKASRAIRSGASYASFNAGVMLISALLLVLSGLTDPFSLVAGLAFGALGLRERHWGRKLRDLNPAAPLKLAQNQGLLWVAAITYCAVAWYRSTTGPSPLGEIDPALAGGGIEQIQELIPKLYAIVYGSVVVVTTIFQTLSIFYYLKRGRILRQHLAQTPAWVVDVQRAAA